MILLPSLQKINIHFDIYENKSALLYNEHGKNFIAFLLLLKVAKNTFLVLLRYEKRNDSSTTFLLYRYQYVSPHFMRFLFKNAIDQSFKKQEKQNQYMAVVLSNLNGHLLKLKDLVISLQSGLSENTQDSLKSLFIIGGDIQSYCENYKTFFEQINKKEHKDVFAIRDHELLLEQFFVAGKAMNTSPHEFGFAIEEIRKICIKLIQHYNSIMLNY